MWKSGSSHALLFRLAAPSSGTTKNSTRGIREEKHGALAHVNANNCFLACHLLSASCSLTKVGERFIDERHIPGQFTKQLAEALA